MATGPVGMAPISLLILMILVVSFYFCQIRQRFINFIEFFFFKKAPAYCFNNFLYFFSFQFHWFLLTVISFDLLVLGYSAPLSPGS